MLRDDDSTLNDLISNLVKYRRIKIFDFVKGFRFRLLGLVRFELILHIGEVRLNVWTHSVVNRSLIKMYKINGRIDKLLILPDVLFIKFYQIK